MGMIEELWSTKIVAGMRFELIKSISDLLAAEWGGPLALFVRNKLTLSDTDYEKLRLAFCKRYDSATGLWKKRPMYTCPCSGRGLSLSDDGKVCERSLVAAARQLINRDQNMLRDLATHPWYLTFGIDGTAVSGKRAFTHAMLSLGAMYKPIKAVLIELKGLTLAIAQHHDDFSGLDTILHRKSSAPDKAGLEVTCLAEEIEDLYWRKKLRLENTKVVECNIKCCLDLAAARGMRGSRGKTACLCGCQGKEGRQKLPGDDGIPPIPPAAADGADHLAVWTAVQNDILSKHCSYNSSLMSFVSLQAAAHIPPDSWDPSRGGPWRCPHCKELVFGCWADFEAAKATYISLRDRAKSTKDKQAMAELNTLLGKHASMHLDQTLFSQPVLRVGTDIFIVDPLHALNLNAAKVVWKYSFMDKMEDTSRELASAYMESIDCYLHLRTKGQCNLEQRFMTGATVDDFVMGKLRTA
eukprot:3944958-Pleurochrysis_carterae.AAC.3